MADYSDSDLISEFNKRKLGQGNYGTLGALGGVIGAYAMGNNVSQGLGASNGQIDQQVGYLQDMYNPSGVVAQQMARELAAKDAAAGRNSQYGARSAMLQAQLARGATQNAQAIGGLQQQRNQNNLQQQQVQAQQLATLFNLADKSGYLQKANNGLGDLFKQYFPDTQVNQPMPESVYGGGGNYGGYTTGSDQNYQGYGGFNPTVEQGQLGSGTWSPQTDNAMSDQAPQQWGSGAGTNYLDFLE